MLIVYSLKVVENCTSRRTEETQTVRVTGQKGAEGCREATEALAAQDGEAKPNRHAQKTTKPVTLNSDIAEMRLIGHNENGFQCKN